MSAVSEVSPGREAATDQGPALQFLTFSVGDEVFAMNISTVREIIQLVSVTTVPLMPDFVRGVINLRGAVVPVIDLQSRFGRGTTVPGKKTCVVIFDSVRQGEKIELGLLVDSVSEVVDIASDQMEPPPQFGTSIRRDFIQSLGKVRGVFVAILDPDRTLDLDDMVQKIEQALGH